MRTRIQHNRIEHKHKVGVDSSSPNPIEYDGKRTKKFYYWIWFDRDENHKGVWGSYLTYEEAERKAVSKLNTPYEIVKLPTRDEGEASRLLRSKLLDESGNVERTFNRFSHKEK